MEDLFEKISRLKVRFNTPRGAVTVEDLWDLPLTSTAGKPNLDDIAKGLHRQLKSKADEPSFVEEQPANVAEDHVDMAFAVVKRVIEVKMAERKAAREATDRREKKQKILSLIAQKQDEKLSGASLEELTKMAEEL